MTVTTSRTRPSSLTWQQTSRNESVFSAARVASTISPQRQRSDREVRETVSAGSASRTPGSGSSLTIDRITQVFEKNGEPLVALQNVSLKVRKGEFLTLVGPSGCGKSTLLKIIAGLLSPTSGSVYLGRNAIVEPREEIGLISADIDALNRRVLEGQELSSAERGRLQVLIATLEAVQERYQSDIATTAQPALDRVNAVIRELAMENNYTIVLDAVVASNGLVVFAQDGLDITPLVLERIRQAGP